MSASGRFSRTRRYLLLAGVSGVGAVVAGKWSLEQASTTVPQWIEAVVRRNLPGVRLDAESLAGFCQSTSEGPLFDSLRKRAGVAVAQTLPMAAGRVAYLADALERLERQVLTQFLLGSNFFLLADPWTETVVHHGFAAACAQPFAVFRES